MTFRYAVIGSGRQGTAAAYDLARFGQAEAILMCDADHERATQAAARVNRLTERSTAKGMALDAGDEDDVAATLKGERIDAFLSAVPYTYNLGLTRAAIDAGASMVDLGGNSEVVLKQLALDSEAADASVSTVPDCGQVPGMGTSLILFAMEQLESPREAYMWDCGLPQRPAPPWKYSLTFNIAGLTNEYHGDCLFIREGKKVAVRALEELEVLHFPEPIGTLEAFTTAGGLTTAAQTFGGRLHTLQNKTLRYPGHFAQLKVMQQLGLFELDPVEVDGQAIVPRHLLHRLWEPQIRADPQTRDFILIHILVRGLQGGAEAEVVVDLVHRYDEATGFTAMEQATGWHAAIILEAIAFSQVRRGVIPVEEAMSGSDFVAQAERRGFEVRHEVRSGKGR